MEEKKAETGRSMLNSTHDMTLQNRTAVNHFNDEDGAENLFAMVEDDQDELMNAQVQGKSRENQLSQRDKDVEMLFGNED